MMGHRIKYLRLKNPASDKDYPDNKYCVRLLGDWLYFKSREEYEEWFKEFKEGYIYEIQ